MNRVVGGVTGANQVFGIEQKFGAVGDVACQNRIQVMNDDSSVNIEAFHAEVTAVVADNNPVAELLPFVGTVEGLVQISVEAEGFPSDAAVQPQISESFLECREGNEFGVGSNHMSNIVIIALTAVCFHRAQGVCV